MSKSRQTKPVKMISHKEFDQRRQNMVKGLMKLAANERHFNTDEAIKTIAKHFHPKMGVPIMHQLLKTRLAFHASNP